MPRCGAGDALGRWVLFAILVLTLWAIGEMWGWWPLVDHC